MLQKRARLLKPGLFYASQDNERVARGAENGLVVRVCVFNLLLASVHEQKAPERRPSKRKDPPSVTRRVLLF